MKVYILVDMSIMVNQTNQQNRNTNLNFIFRTIFTHKSNFFQLLIWFVIDSAAQHLDITLTFCGLKLLKLNYKLSNTVCN